MLPVVEIVVEPAEAEEAKVVLVGAAVRVSEDPNRARKITGKLSR
jgi:hypothetical protein